MKITDYPKDLQRIVELTPEGWPLNAQAVSLNEDDDMLYIYFGFEQAFGLFHRDQYNQCRAQWLAEKGGEQWSHGDYSQQSDRMDRVDWRVLCEELTAVIDGFIEMWDGPKYAMHMIENVQAARPVADKARKALEQTK